MIIDTVLWWTGAITWGALALVGLSVLIDWAVDKVLFALSLKREFFAFFAARIKAKITTSQPHSPPGA